VLRLSYANCIPYIPYIERTRENLRNRLIKILDSLWANKSCNFGSTILIRFSFGELQIFVWALSFVVQKSRRVNPGTTSVSRSPSLSTMWNMWERERERERDCVYFRRKRKKREKENFEGNARFAQRQTRKIFTRRWKIITTVAQIISSCRVLPPRWVEWFFSRERKPEPLCS